MNARTHTHHSGTTRTVTTPHLCTGWKPAPMPSRASWISVTGALVTGAALISVLVLGAINVLGRIIGGCGMKHSQPQWMTRQGLAVFLIAMSCAAGVLAAQVLVLAAIILVGSAIAIAYMLLSYALHTLRRYAAAMRARA